MCDNILEENLAASESGGGGGIPHICHKPHEYISVNFFWPV